MKRKTSNKLNMYQSVHTVVVEFHTTWEGVPAFSEAVNKFELFFDTLRAKITEHTTVLDGVAEQRTERFSALLPEMDVAQRHLVLYAKSIGDNVLKDRNKMTLSKLWKMSKQQMAARCQSLKDDLQAHGNELVPFGYEQPRTDQLVAKLSQVNGWLGDTRTSIMKRKILTGLIADLEKQIDQLLKSDLDSLISVYQLTAPEFFRAFRNARRVMDYGHSKHHEEQNDGSAG